MDSIVVKGAREHNLKDLHITLPRDAMIVISGLSGSGKSSLAFDTIFAEGQRRYVESLSAYARQFLGRMEKPAVDYIEGLSPAISIEQKTTHKNPRSTVGTVTEIYDYLRLLWARIGRPHCPKCGKPIEEQSIDQIIDTIMHWEEGERLIILSPVVRGRKGHHKKVIEDAQKSGFVRAMVDGELQELESLEELDKQKKHDIHIVVDRVKLDKGQRRRITDSVETALSVSQGMVMISRWDREPREEVLFSEHSACVDCGISIPEMQPRLFSFNNPYGACPDCDGLGSTREFDPTLIIPDRKKSIAQGGIASWNIKGNFFATWMETFTKAYGLTMDTPIEEFPETVYNALMWGGGKVMEVIYTSGSGESSFTFKKSYPGLIPEMKRRFRESSSESMRSWFEQYMSINTCTSCGGQRLRPEALAVKVGSRSIFEVSELSVEDGEKFFNQLTLTQTESHISEQILKEIRDRLAFLSSVGLSYLNLSRGAATLSGGEAQRIRLATQIGSSLMGVLYVLDEPTIGLHQRDNKRLIDTLLHLRDLGNTIIVVEHDDATMLAADHIVDLGPGAGVHGGTIVAQGTPDQVKRNKKSLTGQYLAGKLTLPRPEQPREGRQEFIRLKGAKQHNLKSIDVTIPLGVLGVISGVSGSGKSTLMNEVLEPALQSSLAKKELSPKRKFFTSLEGTEHIDKVITIDQSPIGRTPRSNPATYVGVFTPIRELFASLPESKARGYKAGRFSFNVKGGRCEKCQGAGTLKIEMHFLPDVYVTCDVCGGKRYNRETLEIRYKGKNIDDILRMTVEDGAEFFAPFPSISRKLQTLLSVGLGYITLGQSALTLSGGEAQRVKLSLELSKIGTGRTFYLLDEPTTGLHFVDIQKLMEVLQRLVEQGNTVMLIEHNMDVIRSADYIVDLGPEGGDKGGELLVAGTPQMVSEEKRSYTGAFLKEIFQKEAANG